MKSVLETNDLVELGWAEAVLADAGIHSIVFDSHTSIIEGSIGAIPRRLMVQDGNEAEAKAVLTRARTAIGRE